jgi:hypothetical protein
MGAGSLVRILVKLSGLQAHQTSVTKIIFHFILEKKINGLLFISIEICYKLVCS